MALLPTAPWRARLAAAIFLVISLMLVLPEGISAQAAGMKAPAPAGTQWEVLAGYNTATHEGVDPYALDIWRVDAETGNTPVLAPFSGTVGYTSETCFSLLTAEVDLLICHVYMDSSLKRGDAVVVGQHIGTVAPDGEAANAGIAHMHLQLNARDDLPGSTGEPIPFAGAYAIEGVDLEAVTTSNGHAGRQVTSTNAQVAGGPSINVGADRTVAAGEVVTLTAQTSSVSNVFWVQQSGPAVNINVSSGPTFSFVAPNEAGQLTFRAIASVAGTTVMDEVQVTVQAPQGPPPIAPGTIVDGQVLLGGISMIVFSGGDMEQLIAAIGCPLPELALWASAPNGNLVQYTMDRPAFVNASWDALFPDGLPELTPLLIKCE